MTHYCLGKLKDGFVAFKSPKAKKIAPQLFSSIYTHATAKLCLGMIASYYGKSSKRWQIKLAQASIQSTAQTVPVTSNRKRKQQKWNFKRVGVRVYSYVYVLPKKNNIV